MRATQPPWLIYIVSLGVTAILLGVIARWGYHLSPLFPNTFLGSPDVLIVLSTVIVAAANISLVMVTKKYTDIAQESIELAREQEADRLAIRFKHGLQIGSHHRDDPKAADVEVWVANLGVRSFLVHTTSVQRHDLLSGYRKPGATVKPPETAKWDEVIAPGEKKTFKLRTSFWDALTVSEVGGVDVEVRVTVGNGQVQSEKPVTEGFYFNISNSGSLPVVDFRPGFGAMWFPFCDKCGNNPRWFVPKGLNSFAEVEERYGERIRDDFLRTCPNHASELLDYSINGNPAKPFEGSA